MSSAPAVVKLSIVQQGQESYLIVDPTGQRACVIMVNASGNITVRDVQDLTRKG